MTKFILDSEVTNREEILDDIMKYLWQSFYDPEMLAHIISERITARQYDLLRSTHGAYDTPYRVIAEKIIQEIKVRKEKALTPQQKEKAKEISREETDKLFYTITSNGCREMDEVRFHQAVNEVLAKKLSELSNLNTEWFSPVESER